MKLQELWKNNWIWNQALLLQNRGWSICIIFIVSGKNAISAW